MRRQGDPPHLNPSAHAVEVQLKGGNEFSVNYIGGGRSPQASESLVYHTSRPVGTIEFGKQELSEALAA